MSSTSVLAQALCLTAKPGVQFHGRRNHESFRYTPTAAVVVGFCLWWAALGEAGQADAQKNGPDRRLPVVRALGPITIDGALNESDWNRAPVASGFVQQDPREGEAASEDTEVRLLYDANNLYLGVLAHDREPEGIITSELRKDFNRLSGDAFEIVLDTFQDKRNGYMFATNAQGAKWDAQMINEGREINENWDGLWDVKARVVEAGWYAEIAIPFRTLRFSSADQQTWGINFQRRIRRRNEDSVWAPIPRIYDLQRVSLAGTLEGLQGVRPGSDLRMKPYALGSSGKSTHANVGNDLEAGFDVRYGVTSGLTWDFTINTDFSQVEADYQQVNVTRFSLFFPEKRDFFLENSGIFQFSTGSRPPPSMTFAPADRFGPGAGPGRQNMVFQDALLFFSRRIGLSETGEAIPILGGTRLTGRVGPYSVGALSIQQRRTRTSAATNFTALRVRRNVLANSDIGAIVLNKDADGPHYNRVIGTDANFRFFENLTVNAFAARTFSSAATPRRIGSEGMGRAGFEYHDNFWHLWATYLSIGEGFNDEMGFIPRTGINKVLGYFGPHFRSKRTAKWLREITPHVEFQNVSRTHGALDSRYIDYHLPFIFQDGAYVEIGLNPTTENLAEPFTINRHRGITIPAGRYDFNESFALFRTNRSAPLWFGGRWSVGDFYDGHKQTHEIGGTVQLKGRFNASLNLARNRIRLKAGQYTTDLITARVQYGFSTVAFFDGLVQYNTDAREWSSNLRFNFIHRPLSDFFLVFNERRDSETNHLLDRALIAKMTYMVAF